MIKICIETPYKNEIWKRMKDSQIKISKKNPDFVITYGGDGTILRTENKYPSVPQIPIRKSHICNSCVGGIDSIEKIKEGLLKGNYRTKEFGKVEAIFGKQKLVGLNEIQIHSSDPRKAL